MLKATVIEIITETTWRNRYDKSWKNEHTAKKTPRGFGSRTCTLSGWSN